MNEFDRQPGAIDDPGMKGGTDPELSTLPPGDTAANTGGAGEPKPAELDLPGSDDPVAWSYVERGTDVIGREGVKIGTVDAMLGTETENIFHGIALHPSEGGATRMILADQVRSLTPSAVQVEVSTEEVEALDTYEAGE
jgi:hypothetical protein